MASHNYAWLATVRSGGLTLDAQVLEPGIEHLRNTATKMIGRQRNHQASLGKEILSLRQQLEQTRQAIDEVRREEAKAVSEAAKAIAASELVAIEKASAEREIEAMREEIVAERQTKLLWKELAQDGHRKIVALENEAREAREARHRERG